MYFILECTNIYIFIELDQLFRLKRNVNKKIDLFSIQMDILVSMNRFFYRIAQVIGIVTVASISTF